MDARFEDAPLAERPLRLAAETAEDLEVISALMQDAVGRAGDVAWLPKKRRLVLLANRFRWEAAIGSAERRQRVRAALTIEGAMAVRARGLDPADRERVYGLLALAFEPGADGAGTLRLTLAGGPELAVEVECLDVTLSDLTQPWQAARTPEHGD